jgi:hypothetical protein
MFNKKDPHYWADNQCRRCGCGRAYFSGAKAFYYWPIPNDTNSGTFEMPPCVGKDEEKKLVLTWWAELIIVLVICFLLYWIVRGVEEARTEQSIEMHSHLTEDNLKDTSP